MFSRVFSNNKNILFYKNLNKNNLTSLVLGNFQIKILWHIAPKELWPQLLKFAGPPPQQRHRCTQEQPPVPSSNQAALPNRQSDTIQSKKLLVQIMSKMLSIYYTTVRLYKFAYIPAQWKPWQSPATWRLKLCRHSPGWVRAPAESTQRAHQRLWPLLGSTAEGLRQSVIHLISWESRGRVPVPEITSMTICWHAAL